jgi:DNA-binding MarR family transcriptional regulator
MDDFVGKMGSAAIGARLRRLSAMIDADAARVYAAHGVHFEQRWFGVLNQLTLADTLGVRELAMALGISHASVSETRHSLETAGLVESEPDPEDARRRRLRLSSSGKALVAELTPLWGAFDEAARGLDDEAGGVLEALAALETALVRRSLYDRIQALAGPSASE